MYSFQIMKLFFIIENMEHVYNCNYLNIEEPIEEYLKIFTGNTKEKRTVLQRFEQNLNTREQIKEESSHVILHSHPPSSILYEFGNG